MEAVFILINEVARQGLQIAIDGLWIAIPVAILATIAWRVLVSADVNLGCHVWWVAILITVIAPMALNLGPQLIEQLQRSGVFQSTQSPSGDLDAKLYEKYPKANGESAYGYQRLETSRTRVVESHYENTESSNLSKVLVGLLPVAALWFWIMATFALLVRLGISLYYMARLKTSGRPIDIRRFPRLAAIFESYHVRKRPTVAVSETVSSPLAAGLGRPMVLLPQNIVDNFSEQELEMIVLHELTHLARRDDWAKLIQRLVQAILFFNPFVHLMARRLDLAREMACDERVVTCLKSTRDYAHCLARLAALPPSRTPLLATGAMTGRKHIIRRFDQLSRRAKQPARPLLQLALIMIALLTLTAASVRVAPVMDLPLHDVSFDDLTKLLQSDVVEATQPDLSFAEVTHKSREQSVTHDQIATERKSVTETIEPQPEHDDIDVTEAASPVIDDQSPETPPANAIGSGYSGSEGTGGSPALAGRDDDDDDDDFGSKASRWVSDVFDNLSKGTSIMTDGHGNTEYSWSDGRHKLQMRTRGDIEISDDDRTITSISRRGYVVIAERIGRDERELEIEPGDSGLTFTYYEDGQEQEFDEEARKWFADVLLSVIRNTGWNAEKRVQRIYRAEGTEGVLGEIHVIEGDNSKRLYYEVLLDVPDLSTEDYNKIIAQAGREIDSDYEKAELLISLSDNIDKTPELMSVFVDAVATIDSDYETRRVLSNITFDHSTDRAVLLSVLEIAGGMDSDYEKAELLIEMAEFTENDPELQVAYVNSIQDIDSDYETRRVLTELIQSGPLDSRAIDHILKLAKFLDSDYEKAELLIELAQMAENDPALHKQVMDAVATLDSDYEARRVIESWSVDCRKNSDLLMPLLGSAEHLDSDYECAELLIDVTDCLSADPASFQYFMDIIGRIESDYEKSRVLQAVLNDYRGEFDEVQLKAIILAVGQISSDYEKSQVIEKLIELCRDHDELEAELADLIDTISSDYDADQLLAKLYRRSRDRGSR